MVTVEDLKRIVPDWDDAELFCEPLNAAMIEYDISTPLREAAFIVEFVRSLSEKNGSEGDYSRRGFVCGREQYGFCAEEIGVDVLSKPELLEQPENSCRASAWWWQENGFNELADEENFQLIMKKISGGYPKYRERIAVYEKAKVVFS